MYSIRMNNHFFTFLNIDHFFNWNKNCPNVVLEDTKSNFYEVFPAKMSYGSQHKLPLKIEDVWEILHS